MDALSNYSGFFCSSGSFSLWILGSIFLLLFIGYFSAPLIVWAVALFVILLGLGTSPVFLFLYSALMLIFLIKPLRTVLVSKILMDVMKKLGVVPQISATERTALEAGVVWIEKDLFSGKPDFEKILKEPYAELTKEEKDFINGPVEELCLLTNPWKVWKNKEVPAEAWQFVKDKGFLGMIIPKKYGGLGFSAMAHSEVVMKIATRSFSTSVAVMVPNSLGPAELLVHYGTEAQKNHWLPRLASGAEVPCFGLTEPLAGSDAGSIQSFGDIFRGDDGKLYIKLNWNKRWITLAGISTVIGLAFRLRDPENLLGKGVELGITCALIPTKTKGVDVSHRHDPMGTAFYNCPTRGVDVVVNLEDSVVGGLGGCGHG
ncbi:MAG: acyl-CoA dehydrogenase family protein, partial [Bdellovibrionota bacterium]